MFCQMHRPASINNTAKKIVYIFKGVDIILILSCRGKKSVYISPPNIALNLATTTSLVVAQSLQTPSRTRCNIILSLPVQKTHP
ncbi:hypothetical protein RJT34_05961 [Clitoria ternatea]|uniref:Uncharacterized protein n=1 Tax=Clitoria ternatea TaxID=43366 RepID=A0AAN9K393_CLITE